MRIVWYAHSGFRYAILLSALLLIVVCVMGLLAGKPGPRAVRIFGAVFVGLLDLQLLLGIGLLAGGFYTRRAIGHLAMMVPAVAVAHVCQVLGRKRPGGTYRWPLAGALAALLLISAGVLAIGRGVFESSVPWESLGLGR